MQMMKIDEGGGGGGGGAGGGGQRTKDKMWESKIDVYEKEKYPIPTLHIVQSVLQMCFITLPERQLDLQLPTFARTRHFQDLGLVDGLQTSRGLENVCTYLKKSTISLALFFSSIPEAPTNKFNERE